MTNKFIFILLHALIIVVGIIWLTFKNFKLDSFLYIDIIILYSIKRLIFHFNLISKTKRFDFIENTTLNNNPPEFQNLSDLHFSVSKMGFYLSKILKGGMSSVVLNIDKSKKTISTASLIHGKINLSEVQYLFFEFTEPMIFKSSRYNLFLKVNNSLIRIITYKPGYTEKNEDIYDFFESALSQINRISNIRVKMNKNVR